jgi:outer membrane protein
MTVRPTASSWVATLLVAATATACIHNPPNADGKASAPPSPGQYWTPPKRAVTQDKLPSSTIPPDVEARVAKLTLPDVIDLGLLNNPQTRQSYATARAAGATIGTAYGRYLPQVTVNANGELEGSTSSSLGSTTAGGAVAGGSSGNGSDTSTSPSKGGGTSVAGGSHHFLFQPAVTGSWLLFDFSRSASIEYAKEDAYAASFTHNSTVQAVVLAIEQAYCSYNSAKAVRDGDILSVKEDSANLAAAQERHNAGVATISDVLIAQSTLSSEEFTLETDEGTVQTTRGALAVAVGFPANLPYDITAEPPNVPIAGIADSVDRLVQVAVNARPDLQSYRAQARQAHANIGVVRGQGLPSLSLGGDASHSFFDNPALNGTTYGAQIGVSWPIFQGFTNSYNILQAKELAKASDANAEYQRDQVVYQVFTSYYNLRTATAHVASANDLLTSSQASYDVAIGQYKNGVGSILTVLTAQAALATARSQQAQARWTWYSDLAQLSHDIGTLGVHGESTVRLATDPSSTPTPPR